MSKLILYIVFAFVSAYALTSINYNGIIKKDKNIEVRVLIILLSLSLSYLVTNFIIDFINL